MSTMSNATKSQPATDPIAAKLLDELIVLFNHHTDPFDRSTTAVRESLDYIKRARAEHGMPITLSLAKMFREPNALQYVPSQPKIS